MHDQPANNAFLVSFPISVSPVPPFSATPVARPIRWKATSSIIVYKHVLR